ncbi:MAG: hypothetical protein GY826_12340, partial [Fuerstiella sp.]|nr:hypothetical protein [Fuerstiella sp.]
LTTIDGSLLTAEIKDLRYQCTQTVDCLKQLQVTIDSALKKKQLHGLLKQVDEYLRLQPSSGDMKTLRKQLVERERKNAGEIAKMVQTAEEQHSECRFDDAIKTLRQIPTQLQTQRMNDLLEDCESLSRTRAPAIYALQEAMETGQYQVGLREADMYHTVMAATDNTLNDKDFADRYRACQEALQQQQLTVQVSNQR